MAYIYTQCCAGCTGLWGLHSLTQDLTQAKLWATCCVKTTGTSGLDAGYSSGAFTLHHITVAITIATVTTIWITVPFPSAMATSFGCCF